MPQNVALQQALKNPKFFADEEAKAAFEAIYAVDPNDEAAFKQAVNAHKNTWKKYNVAEPVDDLNKDGPPSFIDLYKLATRQRVISTFSPSTFPEEYLKKFILDNPVEIRKLVTKDEGHKNYFGNLSKSKIAVWDPATETVLTNDEIKEISLAAQTAYLMRKIDAAKNPQDLHAMLQAIDGNNDAEFRRLLVSWQIPQNIADKMTTAEVGGQISRSLAIKAIEISAPHWAADPGKHVWLTTALQRNEDADFANNLEAPYQGKVTPEDSKHLRGKIGSELIKAKLSAEVKGQQVLLLQIAGITELDGLQDALANQYGSQDADHKAAHNQYFKEAVTEANKNSFRQIAASKALAYKIAEMNDTAALDAMARVKTPQDLTQLLAASNAFGLDNPAGKPAREAITDLNEIRKLSALAHIRSNLLPRSPHSESEWQQAAAHADKLATLLDPAFTAANYASQFLAPNSKPEELQPFKDYFRDEARRDEARKMALASLLPIVLKNASPEQLTAITTANDEGGLKQAVAAVLGNQHANDLIDADLGSDYNLKIRASAQLNLMPQLLAGKDYAQLSGIVQAAGWAGFEDGVQTLLNGLNQNDSQNLEAQLIQALVKQYPADQDLNLLTNLSKPGLSEGDFKAALTALGIQRQDWVNPARMQMVQKAASERAMHIQTEKTIGLPLDERPELKKVMQSLSAAKQASLAAKPELIALLASRTKPEQIKELLQERHLDVEALSKENTNHRLLNKIHNPALADVFRNLNIKVDADQVRRINEYLVSKDTTNQLYGLPGLKDSVNLLWVLLGNSNTHINEAAFNRAFGFNDDRTNLANNRIQTDAVTQHTHNEPLIAYRKAVNPANPDGKRRVAAFLMGLHKTSPFPAAQLDSLCAHLDAAKDRSELLNLIQGDPALNAVMPAEFKRQLTEGTYNFLKQNLKSDQLKGMSLENLTAALGTRHAEIQANLDKLHNLQKAQQRSTRSALKAFSEVEEALWLDPVNEGLSKTNAKRIEEDLKNTEKLCNIVIPSLKAHLALIEEQYKSLPQNEANPKKASLITKERQFLKKAHDDVSAELNMYLKIEDALKGNPKAADERMQKGLLAAVEEAKEGKQTVVFNDFKVKVQADCDISEFNDRIKQKDGQRQQATYNQALQVDVGVQVKDYDTTKKVDINKFRPYVIEHQTKKKDGSVLVTTSTILERRYPQDMAAKTSNGQTVYSPSMSLTLVPNDKRTEEQMAKDAIFMAMKIISGLAAAPTPDRPFLLTGDDPKETRLMYGALLAVGEMHPKFKFDEKCIKMGTTSYVPSDDRSWGSNTAYKEVKGHPEFKALTRGFSNLASQQVKAQAELKQVEKSAAKIGQAYKETIQQGRELKKLEEEVRNRPPSPMVGG